MAGLTLWSFLQRQAQFSQFTSSNSSLTMSRYLRLMALAGVELLCTTPLSVLLMVLNLSAHPLEPWVSWSETHYNFSRVVEYPAVLWTMNRWSVVGLEVNRWSGVFCAFIFFAFFGFAAEARKNYLDVINKVLVACRLKRDPSSPLKVLPRSVPLFIFVLYWLTCFFQPPEACSFIFNLVYDVRWTSRVHPPSTALPTLRCYKCPILTRRERFCAPRIRRGRFGIHYICLREAS